MRKENFYKFMYILWKAMFQTAIVKFTILYIKHDFV